MPLDYAAERAAIVEAGKRLIAERLSHGRNGNFSIRVDRGVLVKPSAVAYESMTIEDVPLVALEDGRVLDAPSGAKPSSEMLMHLAILKARPDVKAIAHGHPAHATALAGARKPLPPFLDEVAAFLGGTIEVSAYAPSGTQELADNVAKALGDKAGALIANHGVVAVGRDLHEAFEAMVTIEESARVYLLSQAVGGPVGLPPEALQKWRAFYLKGDRRY